MTAENDAGTAMARSGVTRVSTPPLAVGELRLSGVAEAGYSMRCEADFTGAPPLNKSYEWTRDGLTIANWPHSHLIFGADDVGHTFTCSVIGTNNAGRLVRTSPPIIVAPPRPILTANVFPFPRFTAAIAPQPVRLKTLLSHGVSVRARCSITCTITVKLTPDAATARRLGVRRTTVIGRGTFALRRDRTTTVHVRLTPAAKRAIKRANPRSVRFTVSATEPGKLPVTGRSTLTVRR